ncbi:MAG: septum formation initiator family protein [Bacteriovoracaceae bacterium]
MEFIFEDTEKKTKRRPYSSAGNFNQSSVWTSPSETLNARSVTRKSVPSNVSEVEIEERPKRRRKSAKVNYLKTVKTPKKKKRKEKFSWSWNKTGWLVCFSVFLRLIFMDRGVVHYYQMQETLKDKKHQLELVKEENANLVSEIHQIKVNPAYQKKIARQHLGVIAQDEYLILFAKEASLSSI